jgi:hypothetical protein
MKRIRREETSINDNDFAVVKINQRETFLIALLNNRIRVPKFTDKIAL